MSAELGERDLDFALDGGRRRLALECGATAREYFHLWIENLVLNVLTLGLYSPWAKVRRKRYFYGHTSLEAIPFRYAARPGAILRGRLLFFAVFVVPSTYAAWSGNRLLPWGLLGAAALVAPWVVVRALRFNARCSEYRAIRFDFRGTFTDAAVLVWGWGLVTLVTLGLAYPLFKARLLEFVARNHRYGDRAFGMPDIGERMLGAFVKFVAFAAISLFAGIFVTTAVISTVGLPYFLAYGHLPFLLAYSSGQLFATGAFRAWTTNVFWGSLGFAGVQLRSRLSPWRLGAMYVVNGWAILATLGLATPWAVVRTYRYRIASLEVAGDPSVEVRSVRLGQESALGAAASEGFALDVGI